MLTWTRLLAVLYVAFTVDARPLVFQRDRPRFARMQVFGDSFSDNGNGAWRVSNGTWPADPHYYGHRFSNGPVYAETLAELLGIPLHDAAIGGATTSNQLVQGYTGPGSSIAVPSILDQVQVYLKEPRTPKDLHVDSNTLFVILGGGNDAFFGLPNISASETVANIGRAVEDLKARGARYFLLASMPPLGKPSYPYSIASPETSCSLESFSKSLRKGIIALAKGDDNIVFADIYTLVSSWFAQPERYGFDPATTGRACLVGAYGPPDSPVTVCDKPDTYIYWDEYHPTTRSHALVAQEAFESLARRGWIQRGRNIACIEHT